MNIPFHKPYFPQGVFNDIRSVIESGLVGGDGPICKRVEEQLEQLFSVRWALLTTSCTHALEMAVMMLDLKPGDEVITPSFAFVSSANAILRGGGIPKFCDINDQTQTIDIKDFERKISPKTKAVIPVHYAGVSAEMDEILEIARTYNLVVIEDAAQGVNVKYKERFLGTLGDMGTYSFHVTKNIVSGEGGALLTNNERYAKDSEILREKGTDRAKFLRGEVDKYTWVKIGSSFVLSDLLAVLMKCQLDEIDFIKRERKRIYMYYREGLKDLEQREILRLPVIPPYCESNYHIFYVLMKYERERDMMIRKLKEFGIGSTFHYVPLHSSPYARNNLGTKDLNLPVTDRVSSTLLRLPIYPQLKNSEVEYVVEKIREILH